MLDGMSVADAGGSGDIIGLARRAMLTFESNSTDGGLLEALTVLDEDDVHNAGDSPGGDDDVHGSNSVNVNGLLIAKAVLDVRHIACGDAHDTTGDTLDGGGTFGVLYSNGAGVDILGAIMVLDEDNILGAMKMVDEDDAGGSGGNECICPSTTASNSL